MIVYRRHYSSNRKTKFDKLLLDSYLYLWIRINLKDGYGNYIVNNGTIKEENMYLIEILIWYVYRWIFVVLHSRHARYVDIPVIHYQIALIIVIAACNYLPRPTSCFDVSHYVKSSSQVILDIDFFHFLSIFNVQKVTVQICVLLLT